MPRLTLTVEGNDWHETIDKLDRLSDALRTTIGRPARTQKFNLTLDRQGGRVLRKVDEFAGEAKTQAEDLHNQAAGQAQQQAACLSDVIKDQPITSALVAIGIGYLLGRCVRADRPASQSRVGYG